MLRGGARNRGWCDTGSQGGGTTLRKGGQGGDISDRPKMTTKRQPDGDLGDEQPGERHGERKGPGARTSTAIPFLENLKGSSIIRSAGDETETRGGDGTCPRSHSPGKSPGATLRLKRAFSAPEATDGRKRRRQSTARGGDGPRSHSRGPRGLTARAGVGHETSGPGAPRPGESR